jgi:signal transduction histidine kinase
LDNATVTVDDYAVILRDFITTGSEAALYRASLLSRSFVDQQIGPEDIIAVHVEALGTATAGLSYREQARASSDGLQFLLEVMITFGVRYKEYLDSRLRELAASEADKAEVLAAIAHELRTPLAAATGTLDLARRSLSRGQSDRVPDLLDRSRQAMGHLDRLTATLFDASRGHGVQLDFGERRLDALLAQAVGWITETAADKNVQVVFETALLPATAWADGDALITVFGNLLSNAVRYTPSGGRVTVRHGTDTDHAWVEVEDSGIGMTPEVQARIFDRFYRGPDARSVDARGLGLGLALVREMVDVHNGAIEVRSEVGRGSTFRVILPTHQASKGDDGVERTA